MTREEKQKVIDAVERLNALKQFIGYDKDSEIVQTTQKSLDMAIKALEQEPCEDCISRQAVLDYIDKMPSELTTDGRRMIRRITLGEYISDTLPSVTPKPKTDVLDKIRAEIEQEYNLLSATRADETLELGECLGLKMSLKIIDKYSAEKE